MKIDLSFIGGLGKDANGASKDAEIVSAMIELTHALGLEAIAAGVETAEQLAQLRNLECDLAQGGTQSNEQARFPEPRVGGSNPSWRARVG
jgi:EAL domain-containing protein (putative c-di-GMP-specific phosphodiesterase class I)